MKKILALLILIGTVNRAIAQDSTTAKLNELIDAYAKLGRFNGAALIAQHGRILLAKGFGYKSASDKTFNDTNSVFQIASITKSFTAAVVLKLVENQKMSLDDRLEKYYQGFPHGGSITITQLLNHTSGVRNFTEEDTTIKETDEARIMPYLRKLKPDFLPGTAWHYSNTNYVLLGYIIQKVSGMSYWQAVKKYIFGPLQMRSSGFDLANLKSKDKAIGYDALNDSVQAEAPITDSTVPFAAGAIYSTVTDMYKWYLGLRDHKILNAASFAAATTPSALHDYGFGWQIDSVFGRKIISHSGAISGFGSNFSFNLADDICIVLLSNRSGSTFDIMHMSDKVFALLFHQPYSIPLKRTPVAIDEKVLQNYIGKFLIEEINVLIDVSADKGRLVAQPSRDGHPGPTAELLPLDKTNFYDTHDDELRVTMDIDETGNVKGMRILQRGIAKYAKKIN